MANTKEKRFEEAWYKLLSMVEKDHKLTASKFYKSVSVDKTGFIAWMSSHGYGNTFPEFRSYIIKQLKSQSSVNDNLQEAKKQVLISNQDSSMTNNAKEIPTESPQYWWLNVDSKIWELDKANKNETKTIDCDIQFIEWISNFLIDREDNPHFGQPIAQRELAISLLDHSGLTVDEKNIKAAYNRIKENLEDYIHTSNYVLNPPVVLLAPTDHKNKYRRTAAWMYPTNPDGSIQTDAEGNRLPRDLNKSIQNKTYYFYRKGQVPRHPYDKSGVHDGDPDYVQAALEMDPEINYHPTYSNISLCLPVLSMKKGDSIIACMNNKIVAFADIVSQNEKGVTIKLGKKLITPIPFSSLKKLDCDYKPEKNIGFIPITEPVYSVVSKIAVEFLKYSMSDFLKEVYIDETSVNNIVRVLNYKKNLILQGPPGVGKTFAAKRLAYAIMGEKDDDRVVTVQFHQNYSYEDFVMGYKPNGEGGFDLCEGIFYRFCAKAAADKDRKYFFIIDEINRGNLSKIFGELLMLMEKDYRDTPLQMAQFGNDFVVPSNVYLIGMMNTADRSLAMIDYALRRRFCFYEMKPAFESPGFGDYVSKQNDPQLNKLVNAIKELNKVIAKDDSLGTGFCIGHSYLCGLEDNYDLNSIVEYDIIPMLREYWFDNDERFNNEVQKLRTAIK